MKSLGTTLLLCASVVSQAQLQDVKKDWWSLKVAYPEFRNRSLTAAHGNRASTDRERAVFNKFLAMAKKDVPELKRLRSSAMYELLVTGTVTFDAAIVCSGYATQYAYTGGAHGNTTFDVINIGATGKSLTLQDFFAKGVDGRKEASFAILETLLRSGQGSDVQIGTWKELSAAQSKRFVVSRTGLTFLFNQGELGSQAEGAIKVDVPFSALKGLDYKGQFGGLFSATPMLTDVTWVLEKIAFNDDTVLVPEKGGVYEITFSAGRVSGIGGRNRIAGPYKTMGERELRLGPLISTLMADPDNSIAPRFRKCLNDAKSYFFQDGKLILELPVDTGSMIFRAK
ncbi:MAG TPA: DUF4163 domain-containing protein [Fimbriimonadaceae bacterium]|nr:DUF4163 domain-containing protein [Fimbriimonadaceae bacterium]